MQDTPRFRHQDFTPTEFRRYWSQGIPVVVTGVVFQRTYGPEYFIESFGEKTVTLIECDTGRTRQVKVAEFFCHFGRPDGRTGIWKLKVRFVLASRPPLPT
jgi:hypothetical protein